MLASIVVMDNKKENQVLNDTANGKHCERK